MKTSYPMLIVILAAVAGCERSAPPAERAVTSEQPSLDFTIDKPYVVCDAKFTDHEDETGQTLTGNHLNMGDQVVIGTVGPLVTEVVFNRASAEAEHVPMVQSAPGLATVRSFEHTIGGSASPSNHYVSIENVSSTYERREGTACNGQNIIAIRFCFFTKDDLGKEGWTCSGDLPHYGDVHAEN
jgi:hypothetical protein